MRIQTIEPVPFWVTACMEAARGGGVTYSTVPWHRCLVGQLPDGVQAILATSDLQAMEVPSPRAEAPESRLLGEVIAEEAQVLASLGELPPMDATGVLLCGDLYCRNDLGKRGGRGDVRPVWRAFAEAARWVIGVAGNHDSFGEVKAGPSQELEAARQFAQDAGGHFLDGGTVEVDGLRVGGVSGILGNPSRPFRKSEEEMCRAISQVLLESPDILLLHAGPDEPERELRGEPAIRAVLEERGGGLVFRGHWTETLVELRGGRQVACLDSRVLVMEQA